MNGSPPASSCVPTPGWATAISALHTSLDSFCYYLPRLKPDLQSPTGSQFLTRNPRAGCSQRAAFQGLKGNGHGTVNSAYSRVITGTQPRARLQRNTTIPIRRRERETKNNCPGSQQASLLTDSTIHSQTHTHTSMHTYSCTPTHAHPKEYTHPLQVVDYDSGGRQEAWANTHLDRSGSGFSSPPHFRQHLDPVAWAGPSVGSGPCLSLPQLPLLCLSHCLPALCSVSGFSGMESTASMPSTTDQAAPQTSFGQLRCPCSRGPLGLPAGSQGWRNKTDRPAGTNSEPSPLMGLHRRSYKQHTQMDM